MEQNLLKLFEALVNNDPQSLPSLPNQEENMLPIVY
jgi:hypothetical protein